MTHPYRRRSVLPLAVLSLLTAMLPGPATRCQQPSCPALTDARRNSLVEYVHKKYKLPASVRISLAGESGVEGTCYRRLRFTAQGPLGPFDIMLYLAPDGRFMSDDLLDSQSDPEEEERLASAKVMRGLVQSNSPSLGPPSAPVTIVEFSDFECSFCRKAAEMLRKQVLPEAAGKVRLIYKHMPLSAHPWAQKAAEAAACVGFQSGDAFWRLHDLIFDNQMQLDPDNLQGKLLGYVKSLPGVDVRQYQVCVENQMSLGLVLRDRDLAAANHVVATPTFFVNGVRLEGLQDAASLRSAIDTALRESRVPAESNREQRATSEAPLQ